MSHETSRILRVSAAPDLKRQLFLQVASRSLLTQVRHNFQNSWSWMLHHMEATVHPDTNMFPLVEEWRGNAESWKALKKLDLLSLLSPIPTLRNLRSPPSPKISGLVSFMPLHASYPLPRFFFFFPIKTSIYVILPTLLFVHSKLFEGRDFSVSFTSLSAQHTVGTQ